MKDLKIDYVLSVNPLWAGEAYDAMGLQHALEQQGKSVYLNAMPVLMKDIRAENNVPFRADVNINFHSSFHLCRQADRNFLYYHEVHDKESIDDIPFHIFNKYDGVMTTGIDFALQAGIDPLILAADPYYFSKVELNRNEKRAYDCDVVFIGSMHGFRDSSEMEKYILPLKEDLGYKVHLWGTGWDKETYGDSVKGFIARNDAQKAYAGAKVGLNIICEGMLRWGAATNRLFQMGACGLPSVSYRCTPHFRAYPRGVLWATAPYEFVEQANKLLCDDELREKQASDIYRRTMRHNLWEHRIPILENILNNPSQEYRKLSSLTTSDYDLRIVIPSTDPSVACKTALAKMCQMGTSKIRFKIDYEDRKFRLDRIRRQIADDTFLQGIPYLLFIDDDVEPVEGALEYIMEDIMKYGYDIMSGWYRSWVEEKGHAEPLVYVDDGFGGHVRCTNLKDKGFVNASRVGAGFLLISRKTWGIFKAHGVPLFADLVGVDEKEPEVQQYGAVSEDFWFCDRAREFEIPIVVDTRCYCKHHKSHVH